MALHPIREYKKSFIWLVWSSIVIRWSHCASVEHSSLKAISWFRPTKSPTENSVGVAIEITAQPVVNSLLQHQVSGLQTSKQLSSEEHSRSNGSEYENPKIVVAPDRLARMTQPIKFLDPKRSSDVSYQNLLVVVSHNFQVSYVCRQHEALMSVNLKVDRPFYGSIQALRPVNRTELLETDKRRLHRPSSSPLGCYIGGDGEKDFNLTFSFAQYIAAVDLDSPKTSRYCGPLSSKRLRSLATGSMITIHSVVLSIQLDKQVQSADDRVIALNCSQSISCKGNSICDTFDVQQQNDRLLMAGDDGEPRRWQGYRSIQHAREEEIGRIREGTCDIWKFPRLIVLFWSLSTLVICMLVSNCLMCLSIISYTRQNKRRERRKRNNSAASTTTHPRLIPSSGSQLREGKRHYHGRGEQVSSQNKMPFVLSYDNEEENPIHKETRTRNERIIK